MVKIPVFLYCNIYYRKISIAMPVISNIVQPQCALLLCYIHGALLFLRTIVTFFQFGISLHYES